MRKVNFFVWTWWVLSLIVLMCSWTYTLNYIHCIHPSSYDDQSSFCLILLYCASFAQWNRIWDDVWTVACITLAVHLLFLASLWRAMVNSDVLGQWTGCLLSWLLVQQLEFTQLHADLHLVNKKCINQMIDLQTNLQILDETDNL